MGIIVAMPEDHPIFRIQTEPDDFFAPSNRFMPMPTT